MKRIAVGVGEVPALSPHPFGDQTTRAVDPGGVKLHELHVLERVARSRGHRAAIAGAGVRRGAREVGAPVSAGREHRHVRAEAVQCAVLQVPGDQATAPALLVDQQIDREVLDEKLRVVLEALLIEGVQDGVPGAVGRGAGALGGAFAEAGGHATERALVDLAVFGSRERHAVVLELHHRGDRLAAHVLDGILVAEPVRPLHGVVHMPGPMVFAHVTEGSAHSPLGRHGVAAGREQLGDARGGQPFRCQSERRPQASASRSHYDYVVAVVDERVGGQVRSPPAQCAEPRAGRRRPAAGLPASGPRCPRPSATRCARSPPTPPAPRAGRGRTPRR